MVNCNNSQFRKLTGFYGPTPVFSVIPYPIRLQFIVLTGVKSAPITYLRGGGEKNTGGTTGRTRVFFGQATEGCTGPQVNFSRQNFNVFV
jgi:hypothetical protein